MTHGENDGRSRSAHFSSLETVALLLSTSQSRENAVAVQYENESARICYFRAGDIDGSQSSTTDNRLLITERGHCLPLVPTNQPKHAAERYEAINRLVKQGNT